MQLLLCARLWTWDPEELMACGLGTKVKTECITGYMTRQLLLGPVNAQAWGGDSREGFRGVIKLGTVYRVSIFTKNHTDIRSKRR